MRVWITRPPGIFADGTLKGVISEQDGPDPHIVVEMNVAGVNDRVEVTFSALDLYQIVQLARSSKVQKIREAVR